MAFDATGFMQAKLVPRTQAVRVPALADWFDGEPVWTVRGITANGLAKVNDAERRNKREGALVEAITSGAHTDIVTEMQRTLGRTKDTMPDLARRLEILVQGSVDPQIGDEMAVRLADKFPVLFFELTNTILQLSGRGAEAEKKPQVSGESQKSAPA